MSCSCILNRLELYFSMTLQISLAWMYNAEEKEKIYIYLYTVREKKKKDNILRSKVNIPQKPNGNVSAARG